MLASPPIASNVMSNYLISVGPGPQVPDWSLSAQPVSAWRRRSDEQESFRPGYLSLSLPGSPRRSLASDLTTLGIRFIFSQVDIIASSALAYRYTTEFYRNLTAIVIAERRSSPPSQKLVILYGALKLTAAYAHGQGFNEELLAKVIATFAEYMLDMLALVLIGTFRLAVRVKGDIRVWMGVDIAG